MVQLESARGGGRYDMRVPRSALVFGWMGVIPFAAFAGANVAAAGDLAAWAGTALVAYGAAILSFLGGAQWGLAMSRYTHGSGKQATAFAISVLPALAGFAALLLPGETHALGLLALGFALLLAYDLKTVDEGRAPIWYRSLRLQLTSAVILCLVSALVL